MTGVAVIGLGNAFAPHARSLVDLKNRVRVIWAVSRTERHLAAVAEGYHWPVTSDVVRAINDPAVEAVLVLTPANMHRPIAAAAFAAGKHVLCEKPLAASLGDAERLIAAGRRADRRLGVVLQARFRTACVRLRTALTAGELGEVQAAAMSVPWWRPQSYYDQPGRGTLAQDGGGVLMTQAIHTLDLFRWLLGISGVQAAMVRRTALHRMETEDYVAALVRLGNGAPGCLTATTAHHPGRPEWIEVIGDKAAARLEGVRLHLSFVDGRQETLAEEGGSGSGADVMAFSHAAHRALHTDFLDAIDAGRDPAVPGEEALATQHLIETILARGTRDAGVAATR